MDQPSLDPRPEHTLPADTDDEIAQVRAARHRISERVGHDPRRLVAHYVATQAHRADRISPSDRKVEDQL